MPATPPDLISFGFKPFVLIFEDGGVVNGALDSLTAVPLPPAVMPFGTGLVALVGLGARSRWQKGHSLA